MRMTISPAHLRLAVFVLALRPGALLAADEVEGEKKDTTAGQYIYTVRSPDANNLQPFEFHGYFRTGFGMNLKGGDQDVFWLPMAGGSYRLGNETGTWAALNFVKNWGGGAAPFVQLNPAFTFQTSNNLQFTRDSVARIGQLFARLGNVLPIAPEAMFWAGFRSHLIQNIHINQFVPFDIGGYGGGVEDIPLCFGKLSMAYIGASRAEFQLSGSGKTFTGTENGRIVRHTLDMYLKDIPVPLGDGMVWMNVGYMPGGQLFQGNTPVDPSAEITRLPSGWGFSAGFLHTRYNFFGGTNKALVQYGRGINFGLRYMTDSQDDLPSDWVNQAWRVRAFEYFDAHPIEALSLMAVAGYEYTRKGFDVHWATAGVNPIWHITEYLGLAGEVGIDYVSHRSPTSADWNYAGYLWKAAISPQVAVGRGYWARPLVRAYFAYANWADSLLRSAEIRRRVGGLAHQDTTHGMSLGVQVEAWW